MVLYRAIIGSAGTGKSWRIQQLLENDKRYALKTSTSGISAVHIGGATINSTLGYFNSTELLYKLVNGELMSSFKKIRKEYDRLFIDELSFLSAQQLNCLVEGLVKFNEKYSNTPLGLEISGDFGQLATVEGDPAFESKHWKLFEVEYLTEIKRQDNREFIQALTLLREGKAGDAADWLEAHVGFHKLMEPDFLGTTIVSTNKEVDSFNFRSLKKVESVEKTYPKIVKGKQRSEWNNIPAEITVKPGCSVIMLTNELPKYANGDLAIVKEVFHDYILVEIVRSSKEYLVGYKTLENIPLGSTKKIGEIQYIPIRLSYALTVHKTQGLTLDAAQIKFTNNFWKELHGGLYVACSRVKTPGGLRLVGTKDQFIQACKIDPRYKPYINKAA